MRALSGELDYRIRYDVEHDLFHAQNVFNDEYIKPTFVEYVQKLEKEKCRLERKLEQTEKDLADYQFNYPTIKELQEENTELKKEVLEVRQHLDLTEREWGKDTVKLIHFKTQLAKARKIINKLIEAIHIWDCKNLEQVETEAEQFLKENA